jgi:universal stress protein A
MPQIKRILVPTDFSHPSDVAVTYAIDLACKYRASIHLVHVMEEMNFMAAYPDGFFAEIPALRDKLRGEAESRLLEAARRCSAVGIQTTTQVADGRPARVISEQALERGIELIVMGTHGRSGVAHFLLGSVAEHVVRTAPCPVFTVRDTARVADAQIAEAALKASQPAMA